MIRKRCRCSRRFEPFQDSINGWHPVDQGVALEFANTFGVKKSISTLRETERKNRYCPFLPTMIIPQHLAASCQRTPERAAWLAELPGRIRELLDRWSLRMGTAFEHDDLSCAWVALVSRADGTRVVLKLGMPHFEGEHEIAGLRFWQDGPTVRLLEADDDRNAMLLEECYPGSPLREMPEQEQDVVIAGLLRRLWRKPTKPHPFRPLAEMLSYWAAETLASENRWPDPGLVKDGLGLFAELPRPSEDDVLLVTDLHAGNVLRAQREAWLMIDPKPFVGDRAYDATQHFFNCEERMFRDPHAVIQRMADLLELDQERVRLWLFARAAAEPRDNWNDKWFKLARSLMSNAC